MSNTQNQPLTAETVLHTLRQHPELFTEYDIKTLALFGSTARNQAREDSDLDFVVEFDNTPTFRGYMGLKFYLEDLFNRPIDLVIKKSIKPIIREHILNELIDVQKPETISQ
ncbi:MAG: nucleotidyltransferase [Oscillatoriales cyanobacterium]|nr:MAG: nucleotidyltransferase [Oscillatoriales cyanobacterium]